MNEEKDRFGDFISLLERAREDVYFAEKDRELLEKLKRRLEQPQQDQVEHGLGNCPQCGLSLQNSGLMNFAVSRCSGCGGIWVERAALEQFLNFLNMKKIEPDTTDRWSQHSLRYVWAGERRQVKR
jgi:Zn-finger nucleic acid-binding protein